MFFLYARRIALKDAAEKANAKVVFDTHRLRSHKLVRTNGPLRLFINSRRLPNVIERILNGQPKQLIEDIMIDLEERYEMQLPLKLHMRVQQRQLREGSTSPRDDSDEDMRDLSGRRPSRGLKKKDTIGLYHFLITLLRHYKATRDATDANGNPLYFTRLPEEAPAHERTIDLDELRSSLRVAEHIEKVERKTNELIRKFVMLQPSHLLRLSMTSPSSQTAAAASGRPRSRASMGNSANNKKNVSFSETNSYQEDSSYHQFGDDEDEVRVEEENDFEEDEEFFEEENDDENPLRQRYPADELLYASDIISLARQVSPKKRLLNWNDEEREQEDGEDDLDISLADLASFVEDQDDRDERLRSGRSAPVPPSPGIRNDQWEPSLNDSSLSTEASPVRQKMRISNSIHGSRTSAPSPAPAPAPAPVPVSGPSGLRRDLAKNRMLGQLKQMVGSLEKQLSQSKRQEPEVATSPADLPVADGGNEDEQPKPKQAIDSGADSSRTNELLKLLIPNLEIELKESNQQDIAPAEEGAPHNAPSPTPASQEEEEGSSSAFQQVATVPEVRHEPMDKEQLKAALRAQAAQLNELMARRGLNHLSNGEA